MTAPCLPTKIRCKDCRFSSCIPKYHLVGGLEHFFLFHKNWEYSSQLTFTPSFFRGVGQPPSSHYIPFFHQALRSCVPIPRWGWVVSTTIHNVHMLVIWVSAVSHYPWKKYPSYIPIIWTVTLWYIISSTLAVIGLGRLVSIILFFVVFRVELLIYQGVTVHYITCMCCPMFPEFLLLMVWISSQCLSQLGSHWLSSSIYLLVIPRPSKYPAEIVIVFKYSTNIWGKTSIFMDTLPLRV